MSMGNANFLSSSHNGGGIVNTRVHPLSHSVHGSLQTTANELRDRPRVSRWNGSNLVCIYSPLSCQASTLFLPPVFFVAVLKTSAQRLSGLSWEKNWKRQGWKKNKTLRQLRNSSMKTNPAGRKWVVTWLSGFVWCPVVGQSGAAGGFNLAFGYV